MHDLELGMALEPMHANWASSRVDLGYTEILRVPALTSVCLYNFHSVLGSLCSSIRQINSPYIFDGEHGIALHAMHENWASSHGEGEVS